mmetsp:Transcript_80509/g.248363  ORF Transcript_80509/g.248363 Transcript_80509/m.248363 type:complete len:182 (+) Transcript_80509:43-588(+)
MALGAPWRDPRFARLEDRRVFESTQSPGAAHGAMFAAGVPAKERNTSLAPLQAIQAPSTPTSAWRTASPAYTTDPRFLPGKGPRPQITGLEHRRRKTSEFCPSRGASGAHHCCQLRDMRPAGIPSSLASPSESPLSGWQGYEQSGVRKASRGVAGGAASCPDLQQLADCWGTGFGPSTPAA